MPSSSRRTVVEKGEVGVYHCWNRCVQRAWLCGQDPVTGIDYGYRREVIEEVERQLAGLFAIDIGFHAEQANHLHLILRTRPDLAATYLDDEVRRRWWILVRLKRTGNGRIEEPTAEELERERRRWPDVDVLRQRLADVSWFMGTLCEHLARRFNRESGTSGTFWEHRFGCRSLEDEAAILLCGIYVDLNPIRAGEATVPEEARYTSAYNRIQGMPQRASRPVAEGTAGPDDWLCPLTIQEDDPRQLGAVRAQLPWRASDKGLLPIRLETYLELLDWTGRQIGSKRQGSIPSSLAPILERLGIQAEHWLEAVRGFDRRFGQVVGSLARLREAAQSGRPALVPRRDRLRHDLRLIDDRPQLISKRRSAASIVSTNVTVSDHRLTGDRRRHIRCTA